MPDKEEPVSYNDCGRSFFCKMEHGSSMFYPYGSGLQAFRMLDMERFTK